MIRQLLRLAAVAAGISTGCVAQSGSLSLSLNPTRTARFVSPNGALRLVSLNVALTMAPGAGPAAIQWTLNYPAAAVAQIVAVAGPAAGAANKTLTCAGNRCVLWGLDAQTIQTGVVAVVTVELAGAPGAVAFQLTEALAASPLAGPILISAANAPLVVSTNPPPFPRSIAAGLGLLYFGVRLGREKSVARAHAVLLASVFYLPALLAVMVLDRRLL